jgi:hypothetical protein
VVLAGVLCYLGVVLPHGGNPLFLGKFLEAHLARLRHGGGPEVREKAVLPLPQRYVERTRAEVRRRMAAADWDRFSRDEKTRVLLEVLLVSGIDAEYWTLPPQRQRQVADAYVGAFLDPR